MTSSAQSGGAAYPPGSLRVGSVAGIPVLVRTSWVWIALLLAWVMAPRIEQVQPDIGAWKYLGGLVYAVLLYGTVLLHELSHAVMARRLGLPVRAITLHFLGGATEIEGEPRTPRQEFWVAVVGPVTSLVIGGVTLLLVPPTPDGLLRMAVESLAFTNLVLGVINLVPGLPLDGGRVLRAAIWKGTDNPHRGTIAGAWGGRVCAILVLAWPLLMPLFLGVDPGLFDLLVTMMVAGFLWLGASASLTNARIRKRLPSLRARPLARPALAVPDDLPLAEAVRRARESESGAILTHAGDGRLTGVVDEAALSAVPEERRPWLPISAVARTFEDSMAMPADLAGEELVVAMGRAPASEYVLVEDDGSIVGVLTAADVDRAFQERSKHD